MKTSLFGAALALAVAAGAAQAQSRSIRDDLYDRDPIGDVLRQKRELSLSRTQESRIKDIRKDLEKRNHSLYRTVEQLEKRIRDAERRDRDDRYDRNDRNDRDDRSNRDDRYDSRRSDRYDNRSNSGYGNGRYDDRVIQQERAQLQRAILQIRSNNQRAMQQVRNVLTSTQERRLRSSDRGTGWGILHN
jgi:hypothetical protein